MATINDKNVDLDQPVWDNPNPALKNPDVQSLFVTPYFVNARPNWIDCMKGMGKGINLDVRSDTWSKGECIYKLLSTGEMPKEGPQFPDDALEMFRLWYNQGGRNSKSDPPPSPLPKPIPSPGSGGRRFVVPTNPVWDAQDPKVDDIKQCFTRPCWIENGEKVANHWQYMMHHFQYNADTNTMLDLKKYEHVSNKALTIYYHLRSGSMPVTPNNKQKFSEEAINAFQLWYEQGCPQFPADIGKVPRPPPIPDPSPPVKKPFQTRKKINDLSDTELLEYRMAVLRLGSDELSSTWQTGGRLHGDWCLHYMQASFPWHRAHLLWLEAQLGVPIPYWNFFSSKAADPCSPDGGIPQAFLDDTFIDADGNSRPNPLRHALARQGKSRESNTTTILSEVQRARELSDLAQRDEYIRTWMPKYLEQLYWATKTRTSGRQMDSAFVYTDPDLTKYNKQDWYQDYGLDFDVGLEQAHDNLHGWCGPDMANNSYAAYDPLFWSFHSNFDRIFENWLCSTADMDKIQWTSTPLRPFIISGPDADKNMLVSVDEDGSNVYARTTDMIKEACLNLGYRYLPPQTIPDYVSPNPHPSVLRTSQAPVEGGLAAPVVFFPYTKCSPDTFYIHVGLDKEPGKKLVVGEPGYIGHITRLGMGPDDGNDRCIRKGILRRLGGARAAQEIKLQPEEDVYLKVLVTKDIPDGANEEVPESDYERLLGSPPKLLWWGGVRNVYK